MLFGDLRTQKRRRVVRREVMPIVFQHFQIKFLQKAVGHKRVDRLDFIIVDGDVTRGAVNTERVGELQTVHLRHAVQTVGAVFKFERRADIHI